MNKLKNYWTVSCIKALKILLNFFLIVSSLQGQTIIEGEIDNSLKVDSFKITYTTNFVEHENIFSRGRDILVKVNEGRFRIQLNESADVFYVKFNLPKNRSESICDDYRVLGNNAKVFMIEPNSAVMLSILPQKVSFSGKQKSLMECQLELFGLYAKMNKEKINLRNSQGVFEDDVREEEVWRYLHANKAIHDSAVHEARNIVSNYSMSLDSLTRNSIYYNFFGNLRFFEINYMNLKAAFSNDAVRAFYVDYYNEYYSDEQIPNESKTYLGQSNMYPKFLAYKAFTDILMRLAPLGREIKPNPLLVDDLIADRYDDFLYDQVAFSSLLLRGTKSYIDDLLFARLVGNIQNSEYKGYIEEMKNRRSSGQKSYQFELEDEHGIIYKNVDFKGKVILLDFWFTGCGGCITLHKNMKPVKKHFNDNPNFIYVSISIDRNKEMWKKSLESGTYSDSTDLRLWLGTLGSKHPLITYYDIASYPTMILVNGKDEVIAMNPPNPFNEQNKRALINMIEEALNE